MREKLFLFALVLGLAACDNSSKVEIKADSLKQRLDTSLGKLKDSVKTKGERTLETVKEKIEELKNKKDTTNK